MKNELLDIYKCSICGNIVEVVHSGDESLVCCGDQMGKITVNAGPKGSEKHIPVITVDGNTVTVSVGSVTHPMLPEHYIEWIELISDDKAQRITLNPGDDPKVTFDLIPGVKHYYARAYCNVHGLWLSENNK